MTVSDEDRSMALDAIVLGVDWAGLLYPPDGRDTTLTLRDLARQALSALMSHGWGPRPTVTRAELEADPEYTTQQWFAVINDEIGGYAIANVDKPVSAHDLEKDERVLGDFFSARVAMHVADVHNRAVDGWGPRPTVSRTRIDEYMGVAVLGGMSVLRSAVRELMRECGVEVVSDGD